MRKVLFILLITCTGIEASAQTTPPATGTPSTLNRFAGGLRADSVFILPIRDTAQWFNSWGNLTIHPQNGMLLYRSNGTWHNAGYGLSIDTNFIRNQIGYQQTANYRISGDGYARTFVANDGGFAHGDALLSSGNASASGVLIIRQPDGNDAGFIGSQIGKMYYNSDSGPHEFSIAGISKARFDANGIEVTGRVKQGMAISAMIKADASGVLVSAVATVDYVTPAQLADSVNGIDLVSATFTGANVKTWTGNKGNGSWIQASFTDNDNQTLSLSSADSLSISGGNTIHLPYVRTLPGAYFQSFTGSVSNTFTLSSAPAASSPIYVTMNNAWLDPVDWSRTGATITLSFNTSSTDLITIYYAH